MTKVIYSLTTVKNDWISYTNLQDDMAGLVKI